MHLQRTVDPQYSRRGGLRRSVVIQYVLWSAFNRARFARYRERVRVAELLGRIYPSLESDRPASWFSPALLARLVKTEELPASILPKSEPSTVGTESLPLPPVDPDDTADPDDLSEDTRATGRDQSSTKKLHPHR